MAIGGAIAFSGKAIIVKLAYRYGVDAVTLIMLRMVFALPFFLVLLLNWRVKGQPVSRAQWVAMAVSYAGALLVFGVELRVAPGGATAWGALLVFLSTFSYSLYLFYSGEYVQRLGALRLGGWATAVACILCILQFLMMRPLSAVQVAPQVLWLSVLNATACTAAPVLLVMMAIERIGPVLTAQVGILGPLATISMGIVLLGEPFTPWLVAGTVLVVCGIYLFSRAGRVGR